MPHAFKLDKEHAKDGLVVILDESQATKDRADLVGFVTQNFIKYGQFTTSGVFITNGETPFPSGSGGIPFAALMGVDGKLLLIGSPSGWGKKLDEAIEPEFKKIKSGWGKSAEAKKIRSLIYGKNLLGEAATAVAAAEGKIKDDAKEDFDEAKIELDTRYTGLKGAIKVLTEAGRFIDAKTAATNLAKAVKGKAEWEAEAAPARPGAGRSRSRPSASTRFRCRSSCGRSGCSRGCGSSRRRSVTSRRSATTRR